MRKSKPAPLLEKVLIEDYAAEGKALARVNGKVIFVEGAVPGDVVDIQLQKNKADWGEGFVKHFHSYSDLRVTPFCSQFGVCGGCQWHRECHFGKSPCIIVRCSRTLWTC